MTLKEMGKYFEPKYIALGVKLEPYLLMLRVCKLQDKSDTDQEMKDMIASSYSRVKY